MRFPLFNEDAFLLVKFFKGTSGCLMHVPREDGLVRNEYTCIDMEKKDLWATVGMEKPEMTIHIFITGEHATGKTCIVKGDNSFTRHLVAR
jgi:hypothetical protein